MSDRGRARSSRESTTGPRAVAARYGIEDTRRAVVEARRGGLTPFCLTIDREAPGYLPELFGARGHAELSRPEILPAVLVQVLRTLIAT